MEGEFSFFKVRENNKRVNILIYLFYPSLAFHRYLSLAKDSIKETPAIDLIKYGQFPDNYIFSIKLIVDFLIDIV